MAAHHEGCVNPDTKLELTVISWQYAWVVCPRDVCVRVRVRACAIEYSWTSLSPLSALLMNWRWANFPILCILLFAQNTHQISTLLATLALSLALPLHCSPPSPGPPPILSSPMSTEAKCQRLWDTFWQHSEHSLSRSQRVGFASVCLSMADQALLFSLNPPSPHSAHVHLHFSSPCCFFLFLFFVMETFASVCIRGEDNAASKFLETLNRCFQYSPALQITVAVRVCHCTVSSMWIGLETSFKKRKKFSPSWWWLLPLHLVVIQSRNTPNRFCMLANFQEAVFYAPCPIIKWSFTSWLPNKKY